MGDERDIEWKQWDRVMEGKCISRLSFLPVPVSSVLSGCVPATPARLPHLDAGVTISHPSRKNLPVVAKATPAKLWKLKCDAEATVQQ